MEDSHITSTNDLGNNISFFGVFDGHGGKQKHIFLETKPYLFCNCRLGSCPFCEETFRQRAVKEFELQEQGVQASAD